MDVKHFLSLSEDERQAVLNEMFAPSRKPFWVVVDRKLYTGHHNRKGELVDLRPARGLVCFTYAEPYFVASFTPAKGVKLDKALNIPVKPIRVKGFTEVRQLPGRTPIVVFEGTYDGVPFEVEQSPLSQSALEKVLEYLSGDDARILAAYLDEVEQQTARFYAEWRRQREEGIAIRAAALENLPEILDPLWDDPVVRRWVRTGRNYEEAYRALSPVRERWQFAAQELLDLVRFYFADRVRK